MHLNVSEAKNRYGILSLVMNFNFLNRFLNYRVLVVIIYVIKNVAYVHKRGRKNLVMAFAVG